MSEDDIKSTYTVQSVEKHMTVKGVTLRLVTGNMVDKEFLGK